MTFAFDGGSYAIDLNNEHAAAFRAGMQEYVSAGRKLKQGRNSSSVRKPKDDSQPSSKEVRAWAQENGVEVSPRGRISDSVLAQYIASH